MARSKALLASDVVEDVLYVMRMDHVEIVTFPWSVVYENVGKEYLETDSGKEILSKAFANRGLCSRCCG